jgi:ATPase subunit of ABC transporter with duplicated ATPase domains
MSQFSVALRNVSKSYGQRRVLDKVSLGIGPRSRLGVLGPNGAGKSTLLRIIAGVEMSFEGEVTRNPNDLRVGYLRQEFDAVEGESVVEALERLTGVADVSAELARTAGGLTDGSSEAANAYDKALAAYERMDAASFESRLHVVLDDVALPRRVIDQPVASLSGGQRARVGLAAVLLSRHDLLLLDEPTNDLDFAGLELLEAFISSFPGGLVLVSHDRALLAKVCTSLAEIDAHSGEVSLFSGGWDAYEHERLVVGRRHYERYAEYSESKKRLHEAANRQRQWSKSGVERRNKKNDNEKMLRDAKNNRTEAHTGRASKAERAIERLEVVDKPWEGWELNMVLPDAPRSGDVVARLGGAVISRGECRLGPVDLQLNWGERLRIAGPNGVGKSTLVSALLGELSVSAGEQVVGSSVVVGRIDQSRDALSGDDALMDGFIASFVGTDEPNVVQEARSLLAKFGLGADAIAKPCRLLSSGERTRALLASLVWVQANLVVLDEPTNHLDIEAIEQLEKALAAYNGTLVVVTHDRRLLESLRIDRTIDVTDLRN